MVGWYKVNPLLGGSKKQHFSQRLIYNRLTMTSAHSDDIQTPQMQKLPSAMPPQRSYNPLAQNAPFSMRHIRLNSTDDNPLLRPNLQALPPKPQIMPVSVEPSFAMARVLRSSPFIWTFEFLSLFCGLGSLIVIAVVLSQADGKPPPHWALGITLNTLLAFLTSFAKVAFTLPIIEGLAHLKWIWFTSPEGRSLGDFALFDNATKGPWGCLKLLLSFRGTLACFGALIATSGIITSTLTQQAVDYQQINAISTSGTAAVQRATTFSLFNGSDFALGPQEMVRGKQAMFNGALSNPGIPIPPNIPDCSSGSCEWDSFGSLAVCSDVVNLTATGNMTLLKQLTAVADQRLSALLNSTSLFLSQGLFFNVFPTTSMPPAFPILVGIMPSPTGMFNDSVTQLMVGNYYVAYSNDQLTGADIATSPLLFLEVALFWCTKTYSVNVHDGVANTTELGSAAEVLTSNPHTLNFAWAPDFAMCYVLGNCAKTLGNRQLELQPPPGDRRGQTEEYKVQKQYTVNVWTSLLSSILLGSTMYDSLLMDQTRGIIVSTGAGIAQAFATAMFGDFLSTESPDEEAQFKNAQGIASNLAGSITNHIRSGDTRYMGDNAKKATVFGTVYSPQTFVRIRWEYIGLLATQIGLTSCFLVAMVVVTSFSGTQQLKGSSLVTMTALSDDTRRHLVEKGDQEDQLKSRAERLTVRLQRDGNGSIALVNAREDAMTKIASCT
ncbi:hypothetical protein GE09DRAFT_1284036 [Coniochaeta sp. 2T2.1]|nr:hypothetical protein GE09DRAFT_1284036 [Coniochaeta sp. 2T2.1]